MKVFKKLASVMLALTLFLGLFGLFACNQNNQSKNGYAFQIVNEEGVGVANASVGLCMYEESGALGACLPPKSADANGYVVVECAEARYQIHVYVDGEQVAHVGLEDTPTTYNSETIVLVVA